MTDITQDGQDRASGRARLPRLGCFMAYTLNNAQPVLCTLVSDQPFFYMQDDMAVFDEAPESLDLPADLEAEMADIRKRLDALDHPTTDRRTGDERLAHMIHAADLMCGNRAPAIESGGLLASTLGTLSKSRTAKAMIDFAADMDAKLIESRDVFSAEYDRAAAVIRLHPDLDLNEACLLLARALRTHWQHRKGALLDPLTFHPDQAVLAARAQAADLATFTVKVCWELQLSGRRDLWGMAESGTLGDIARTFAREAFLDFRSLENGRAAYAAFERWFFSEDCRLEDRRLIQTMLADPKAYMLSDEGASRAVCRSMLAALGEQPAGRNYLTASLDLLLDDPLFTEVRDRSNANFLWFIKFERALHETEQSMQAEADALHSDPSSAVPSGAAPPPAADTNRIVSLLDHGLVPRARDAHPPEQVPGTSNAANVILAPFGNKGVS